MDTDISSQNREAHGEVLKFPSLKCQVCGYVWHPRGPAVPRHCARCNNTTWQSGRKRSPNGIRKPRGKRRAQNPEAAA